MSHKHRVTCGALVVLCFAAVATSRVAAHGALHDQIAAVTLQIGQSPTNSHLYLKRGELLSDHGEWKAALADFDRAIHLDPGLLVVDLARGRTWFNAGQFTTAKTALDRFLAHEPDHAEALVLRARVQSQLQQWEASAEDYTRAIGAAARVGRPNPDYFVERARVEMNRGSAHTSQALRGIEEGILALGPLVSLQLLAIELDMSLGRTDAALARVDSLSAQSSRPEYWLGRRGEILEEAGQFDQAQAAFEQALSAIKALPSRHRRTRGMLELETRLQTALARVTSHLKPAGDGFFPRTGGASVPARPQ